MIRVYDHGSTYGISIGRSEIQGFCLGHPASGLDELRGLWVTFDRTNGNLVGLLKKGRIDIGRMDAAALEALVDGMKHHAETKLGIVHDPDHQWRVDWMKYLGAKDRRQRETPDRVDPDRTTAAGRSRSHTWRFRPSVPVDPAAERIHGITAAELEGERPFAEHAHRRFVGRDFAGAHCAQADVAATAAVLAGMIAAFDLGEADWPALARLCRSRHGLSESGT